MLPCDGVVTCPAWIDTSQLTVHTATCTPQQSSCYNQQLQVFFMYTGKTGHNFTVVAQR